MPWSIAASRSPRRAATLGSTWIGALISPSSTRRYSSISAGAPELEPVDRVVRLDAALRADLHHGDLGEYGPGDQASDSQRDQNAGRPQVSGPASGTVGSRRGLAVTQDAGLGLSFS